MSMPQSYGKWFSNNQQAHSILFILWKDSYDLFTGIYLLDINVIHSLNSRGRQIEFII